MHTPISCWISLSTLYRANIWLTYLPNLPTFIWCGTNKWLALFMRTDWFTQRQWAHVLLSNESISSSSRNYWLTGCVASNKVAEKWSVVWNCLFQCSETQCSSKACERLIWNFLRFIRRLSFKEQITSCWRNCAAASVDEQNMNLVLSNELINMVELPPWKIWKAAVSSD